MGAGGVASCQFDEPPAAVVVCFASVLSSPLRERALWLSAPAARSRRCLQATGAADGNSRQAGRGAGRDGERARTVQRRGTVGDGEKKTLADQTEWTNSSTEGMIREHVDGWLCCFFHDTTLFL